MFDYYYLLLGKTGVSGEKPLGARERTGNPQMASTPGHITGRDCFILVSFFFFSLTEMINLTKQIPYQKVPAG